MVGLLNNFDPTMASLGLLSLGNLFSQRPRYSTNISEVSGPDNSGFNNAIQMGLLSRQFRRDKLLEQQQLRQQRKDDAELAEIERKNILRRQGASLLADPNITLGDPRLRAYAAEAGDLGTAIGLMKPQKPNLLNVAPGASLYDPDTGKPVYSAPVKPDTYSPEAFRQKLAIARAGAQPLPAETEAQRIRIASESREPRLLSPEEEAQRIRIAAEAAKATQAAKPLKDIPATVATGMVENVTALDKIDRALKAIEAYPEATGLARGAINALAPSMLDRYDPKGVDARALIADLGSLKIHDRSGAAVTALEFPRLRPFIPYISDSPETIKTKLKNFRAEYAKMLQAQDEIYSEESGYKSLAPVKAALAGKEKSSDRTATMADVRATALKHNITIQQVIDALRSVGVEVVQ